MPSWPAHKMVIHLNNYIHINPRPEVLHDRQASPAIREHRFSQSSSLARRDRNYGDDGVSAIMRY